VANKRKSFEEDSTKKGHTRTKSEVKESATGTNKEGLVTIKSTPKIANEKKCVYSSNEHILSHSEEVRAFNLQTQSNLRKVKKMRIPNEDEIKHIQIECGFEDEINKKGNKIKN